MNRKSDMADLVLLTGISGFLGGHVGLALLNAGYRVRGSVRNSGKAAKVKQTLAAAGADISRLEIVTLDLEAEAGWAEAMRGVRFLQHTASPFVSAMPRNKMELVRPAVDGTRRAIAAALAANVERVVVTSSMAAIAYGHDPSRSKPYGPADWTNLEGRHVSAYAESKTLAEREAWMLMDSAGRHDDLVVINPYYILGPLLDDDPGTSASLILRLMDGSIPMSARFYFPVVDVRDVAEAHVRAMTSPNAGGHRFPVAGPPMAFIDVAHIIRKAMPEFSKRLPTRNAPDWLVRLFGPLNPEMRGNAGEVGVIRTPDAAEGVRLLGHPLITPEAAILATARDLVARGLVKPPGGAKKG
jgi:nucleoside-diphosphate-sugar epimerase